MAKPGERAWVGRLGLATASLVGTLLLCELVARVVLPPPQLIRVEARPHPAADFGQVATRRDIDFGVLVTNGAAGRRMTPNVRAVHRPQEREGEEVVIETNRYGLRSGEIGPRRPGEVRVLVLGDSITAGCEVHAHELFTNRAETLVSGRSVPIRVINGGVISTDLGQTFFQLNELLGPVSPDVVVIQLYLNDARLAGIFVVDLVPAWLRWSRFLMWAANRIDGWRHLAWVRVSGIEHDYGAWEQEFIAHQRRVYGGDRESFERLEPSSRDHAAGDYGLGWNASAWAEIEKILSAAAELCDDRGVRLGLMLAPVDLQVYGREIDRMPQEYFAGICERLELPCLDLLPPLRGHRESTGDHVFYDQCHLTPVGHEVVARALVDWLDRNQLLSQ